jgi:uncharacterized repeat protein (TIGR03803 family)
MQRVETKCGAKIFSRISAVGPTFWSTKLAIARFRGALILIVLSASLLLTARPAQAQTESVLYSFTGTSDGSFPTSSLTLNNGNFYGTTSSGGLGFGTVFELSPNGTGGWTETTLYSFCPVAGCADGQNPTYSNVIFDSAGNLYGTALGGGANGFGVVFELINAGGTWTESVLHSFTNSPDGANPENGLIMDGAGNLYGIATTGGTGNGKGCVFELSPSGSGWTEKVLYDISSTHSALTLGPTGKIIYGTSFGTIFELTQNSSGVWVPTVLFTFNSADAATEGSNPVGTLVLDSAGNVYGTTLTGGVNNVGVVFKLTPTQTPPWTETLLYSFGGNAQFGPNGSTPVAGLLMDASGNLYGTTKTGGVKSAGTVYELVRGSKGAYKEHIVFSFTGANGAQPKSSLIMDSAGYLYGTAFGGGANGDGAVFEANAHAAITKTILTSSPNPSVQGQPVTFTVTVTSSAGPPPDGETVLIDKIASPPLVGGVATFTTKKLPVGSMQTSATYFGDINFAPSSSPKILQIVNQ